MDNWISTNTEKPPINWINKFDAENEISIRVVIFLMDDSRKFWFGTYYHNKICPHWSLEGYTGFDEEKITHWQYLYPPEQSIHTQQETDNWDKEMDN